MSQSFPEFLVSTLLIIMIQKITRGNKIYTD